MQKCVSNWYLFMQRLSNAVQLVLVHEPSGLSCRYNHPQKTLFFTILIKKNGDGSPPSLSPTCNHACESSGE